MEIKRVNHEALCHTLKEEKQQYLQVFLNKALKFFKMQHKLFFTRLKTKKGSETNEEEKRQAVFE